MQLKTLPFVAIWLDLPGIMLSEISQTERQILCDITSVWNLKKCSELVSIIKRIRLPDTEDKLIAPSGEGEEAGQHRGGGAGRCELLGLREARGAHSATWRR